MLAQKLAHEAEAKQKTAQKEANKELRLREKEERQRHVRERAVATKASCQEQQGLESKKRASAGRQGQRTPSNVPSQPVTPSQVPTPNLCLANPSYNPISTPLNPLYFYKPRVLPHVISTSSSTLNVIDGNSRISWISNGAWKLSTTCTDQRIQRNCS